ncbi:hypothetical protein GQ44DRAFT_681477 [Phaeosphaeriaceae sp. PMI808]|nr:hypothetical protein GQ44DRAFT_681477 [Phaeosphaeriaceae sp. PMI808]
MTTFVGADHSPTHISSSLETSTLTPTCNIVTPVGMLGYGLDSDQTYAALSRIIRNGAPTAIILDSGSTDSGPEKLALGCMTVPRDAYFRDLRKLIKLSWLFRVPLIFSSAGGDGSDEHVRELTNIVREICEESGNEHYRIKTISIFAGVSKSLVTRRLQEGMLAGCGKSVPELTQQKIDATPRIVAQMGPEPIIDAMLANPDFNILIAGRAYDPAPYIAYAAFATTTSLSNTSSLAAQQLWGGFSHMGKILECGGVCSVPKSSGAMATMYQDGTFDTTPLNPESKCTPISVGAHTLYEKTRPDILFGPGGYLDLAEMKIEALEDGRSVRTSGGRFHFLRDERQPYTVKLEGAEIVGYRAHMMGSFRDPILIGQLDNYLERVKAYVALQHEDADGIWELDFHVYGQDRNLTRLSNKEQPSEIFVIGEALASTQTLATSVACLARIAAIHGRYTGQKATSGNFAYGLGGQMQNELGPCAQFSIYHLMQLKEGEERLKMSESSNGIFTQEVTTMYASVSENTGVSSLLFTSIEKSNQIAEPIHSSIEREKKVCRDPKTLGDISSLLRSKNAGPYEITLDVMFATEAEYQLVKRSEFLNAMSMAKLFNIHEDEILWNGFFDQALAYKVTIPRLRNGKPTASGGFMENDVHASQQYIDFMNLALPESLMKQWHLVD